ncbi:CDP-alcohol phosphatidyltransferase family protein, partial [Castellaniella denitrificans]
MTHRWRWIPNALTFLRILLIAPFAAALMAKEYRFALVIFFLASATDAFDGF